MIIETGHTIDDEGEIVEVYECEKHNTRWKKGSCCKDCASEQWHEEEGWAGVL